MRSRIHHLIDIEHDVLAENRQIRRSMRRRDERQYSLERRLVGQHRQAACAAGLVGLRKRRSIELRADESL